jgi:hypothetical protein
MRNDPLIIANCYIAAMMSNNMQATLIMALIWIGMAIFEFVMRYKDGH